MNRTLNSRITVQTVQERSADETQVKKVPITSHGPPNAND